jgi:hypothetical protein
MKKLLLIIATVSALAVVAGAPAEARSLRAPHHGIGIGVGGRGAALAAAATAAAIAAEAYGYGYAPYGTYYGTPAVYGGPGYYAY